jgi:hypothetical protein
MQSLHQPASLVLDTVATPLEQAGTLTRSIFSFTPLSQGRARGRQLEPRAAAVAAVSRTPVAMRAKSADPERPRRERAKSVERPPVRAGHRLLLGVVLPSTQVCSETLGQVRAWHAAEAG